MSLSTDLKKLLIKKGATEVGFADLSTCGFNSGLSIYIAIPPKTVNKLLSPSKEYSDLTEDYNSKLTEIASVAIDFLKSNGYNGEIFKETNKLSHDDIAAKAALGWVGKSSHLITSKYGSAVILTSILTDAPLDYGKAVTASLCGMCRFCTSGCLNGAISGNLWNPAVTRSDLVEGCHNFNQNEKLCGKCIYICPHTQKYLKKG